MWITVEGNASRIGETGFLFCYQPSKGTAQRFLRRDPAGVLHGYIGAGCRAEGLARIIRHDAGRTRMWIETIARGSDDERDSLIMLRASHLFGTGDPQGPRPVPPPPRSTPVPILRDCTACRFDQRAPGSTLTYLYAIAEIRADGLDEVIDNLCTGHRADLATADAAIAKGDRKIAGRMS